MSSGERSIHIGGSSVGSTIITGDHNKVSANISIQPGDVDIIQELAALRKILARLDLPTKQRRQVDNALQQATEEATEGEPDRADMGSALDRALATVKKLGKLGEVVAEIRPHVERAAVWLGENGAPLIAMLGA